MVTSSMAAWEYDPNRFKNHGLIYPENYMTQKDGYTPSKESWKWNMILVGWIFLANMEDFHSDIFSAH